MEFLIKYSWYICVGIILIGIVLSAVHWFFLKLLEKRDYRKNYSQEKLQKKMRKREDGKSGNFYYGIYYYSWQKNKLNTLFEMFQIGEYFTDKYIVVDVVTYSTGVDKIFGNGKREAFYKEEFRIYYKIAEIRKSVVNNNNFIHNGIGNQTNNVYQNDNNINIIVNQLENFLNEVNVGHHDETYIESFIYRFSQGKIQEKDKNKIIETLSKYTSVGNNVVSIITNIAKFFGM